MRFRQAQREIEVLEEQAKAGDRALAYVDEAGFECIHPEPIGVDGQGAGA